MIKHVLFYESADEVMTRAPEHFEAHVGHYTQFREAGTLLAIGTFADPQAEGSMAIFTTGEAANAFAEGDPFVRNGVVRRWTVREWDDVLDEG